MSNPENPLDASIVEIILAQCAIIGLIAITYAWVGGDKTLCSALYGGGGTIMMTALLAWRMKRLEKQLASGKETMLATVVLGFAPRLLLVLILFAVGVDLLNLEPMPMIISFALVHLGYLIKLKTKTI